jgi:rRNA-processing protein FCF1
LPGVVALDTNVLLLLIVGLAKRSYIKQHQCLSAFTEVDFDTLQEIVSQYDKLVVLPNVLTEIANLIGSTHGPRAPLFEVFANFVERAEEIYLPSVKATRRPEFQWLELADCAQVEVAKDDIVILTSDGALYRAICSAGYKAENFSYLTEAFLA